MICKLCFGTGALFAFRGSPQFWPCPACGATGAQAQAGPAVVYPTAAIRKRKGAA